MKVLTGIIRFVSGVLLFLALALAVLLALFRTQKSDLPQIGGYYLKIAPGGSVSGEFREEALVVLKRMQSYTSGDLIAYLNDEGDVSLGRILSINGQTEGATFWKAGREARLSKAGAQRSRTTRPWRPRKAYSRRTGFWRRKYMYRRNWVFL